MNSHIRVRRKALAADDAQREGKSMSYHEPEADDGDVSPETPCGVCDVTLEEHGHVFAPIKKGRLICVCGEVARNSVHVKHDWEMPEDGPEPDEDYY